MLKMMKTAHRTPRHQQHGAAAVEFALIAIWFFMLLLGILEFGRLFYVYNSVQEVTRRAAREAVVRWVDDPTSIKTLALFGGTSLPAGGEITVNNINIEYLDASNAVIPTNDLPRSPEGNVSACLSAADNCIAFVRVSITGATYVPMIGLIPFLVVRIPASTVTMPAESLGLGL